MNRSKTFSLFVAVMIAALVLTTSARAEIIGQLGILDDTANLGINPATGAAWASGDQYRLVFVSSTARDALSGNVADYNAHVQAAASAAGLGSATWNAIASTNVNEGGTATVDARDNTSTNFTVDPIGTSIFLIDGTTKIADDYTDLWDGDIDSQINKTENNLAYVAPAGSPFAQFGGVWTGTDQFGVNRGRAALGGNSADLGLTSVTTSQWTRRAEVNDNNLPLGLYAISDPLTIPGAAVPEPGTFLLATLGLVGLLGLRRRRRR